MLETSESLFLKEKKRLTRASRLDRAYNEINQTIHVRDLVVFCEVGHNHGETNGFQRTYPMPELVRLREHIAFLFDVVTADHRANFCEEMSPGVFQLRKRYQNHITRLSTAEFFLYKKSTDF